MSIPNSMILNWRLSPREASIHPERSSGLNVPRVNFRGQNPDPNLTSSAGSDGSISGMQTQPAVRALHYFTSQDSVAPTLGGQTVPRVVPLNESQSVAAPTVQSQPTPNTEKRRFPDIADFTTECSAAKRRKDEINQASTWFTEYAARMEKIVDEQFAVIKSLKSAEAEWKEKEQKLNKQWSESTRLFKNLLQKLHRDPNMSDLQLVAANKHGKKIVFPASSAALDVGPHLSVKSLNEKIKSAETTVIDAGLFGYSAEEIEILLCFAHMVGVVISEENIVEVLQIASKFKLKNVIRSCMKYYMENLSEVKTAHSAFVLGQALSCIPNVWQETSLRITKADLLFALKNSGTQKNTVALGNITSHPLLVDLTVVRQEIILLSQFIETCLKTAPDHFTPEYRQTLKNLLDFKSLDSLLTFHAYCPLLFTTDELADLLTKIQKDVNPKN